MIRQLTLRDGSPIYVNNTYVVSIRDYGPDTDSYSDYDGPLAELRLIQPEDGWLVRGTAAQIYADLDHTKDY